MRKSQSALIGLLIAGLLLNSNRDRVISAGYSPRSRLQQASVRLYAASGATIQYRTQNNQTVGDIPTEVRNIPHLVLHRNGELTSSDERTLHVRLVAVSVPPGNWILALDIETQHTDPDQNADHAHRLQIRHTERHVANTSGSTLIMPSVEFVAVFSHASDTGAGTATTPTDYFRCRITLSDGESISETLHTQDYAFLMEDQVVLPLPPLQESTTGAAPQLLTIYYTDMVPFQNGAGGSHLRLPRSVVPRYVQQYLAPHMVETILVQTNDWGFPWHAAWTSYREEDGKQIGVALGDRTTWYHGFAPHGGNAGIALNVEDELGHTDYANLTDRLISVFHHELFHCLQRNLTLHYGSHEGPAGKDDAWHPLSEATAVLASSIGVPEADMDTDQGLGHYVLSANRFIGTHSTPGALNSSYHHMTPYGLALYWRFLHEQCSGMHTIRRVLDSLYSGDLVDTDASTDVVRALPGIVDQALTDEACPFGSYLESLDAFARAVYALRLEGGRCQVRDSPDCRGLLDPNRRYGTPPVARITYTGGTLVFSSERQPAPAGIPSSFGMDFVEVDLAPITDGRPLTIEILGQPGGAARFSAQVWELGVEGDRAYPIRPPTMLLPTEEGNLRLRLPELNQHTTQRLAIIIVRTDPLELLDPIGAYTISLRSDA